MHPVLLQLPLGGRAFEVHAFGVMVALGLALGTVLAVREARLRGVDPLLVRDLSLWGLAACLIGARIADIAANGRAAWDECLDAVDTQSTVGAIDACTRPLRLWEGGLVFYGGVAGGLLMVWWFTRRHGMDLRATLDLVTPSVPLGHVLGRMGCLLAGCCWGKPTAAGFPLGISFPDGSAAFRELSGMGGLAPLATRTPLLHPTQIYEAVGELLLFVVVWLRRGRTRFHGELALTWLAGYSALRFVIELFRGDPSRAFLVEINTPGLNRLLGMDPDMPSLLSTSQAIALLVLAGALALGSLWRRQALAEAADNGSDGDATRATGFPGGPAAAPRG